MMAVCVCDCIPKRSSDLRGLQMFKLTMKIKYFPYQKLAFLMNCSGVSEGDMKILAFSGFCLVFTPLFLPAPPFPLLPPPWLPVLASASRLSPSLTLPSQRRREAWGKRCPGSRTKLIHNQPPLYHNCAGPPSTYHSFSPNMWAAGLSSLNCSYRLGTKGGKEQCPHAIFPYQHPGLQCQICGQNLSPSGVKRRLARYHF